MKAFLIHLTTGGFTPSENSLYSRVSWLWVTLLQIAVSLTFAARGWLMYRWDSHIRSLCWHEEVMSPLIIKYTSLTWEDYALESDPYITTGIEWLGIILMFGAVLTLMMRIPYFAIFKWFLIPLWGILALDNLSNYFDVAYQSGMLIEFSLQASAPLLLLWVLVFPRMLKTWGWLATILVSACFIGHGLYAVGYHPVPWIFQTMTMGILGVEEETARSMLYAMGVLDFIVAFCVFIPFLRRPALYYMVLWGMATAVARIWAHYEPAQKYNGLDPWIAECVVRTVHWMIPLLLLMLLRSWNQNGRLTLGMMEISSRTQRILRR